LIVAVVTGNIVQKNCYRQKTVDINNGVYICKTIGEWFIHGYNIQTTEFTESAGASYDRTSSIIEISTNYKNTMIDMELTNVDGSTMIVPFVTLI